MFEIFVDSAANIPAELVKAFKIKVLSFVNLVNGKEMTCFDPDLTPEEERQKGKDYYDMVRAGADIKTGLISSGVFEDAFREALEADKDVLYFSLSKNISGNYNSARIAAEDLMESGNYTRKIRMIDSLNASLAQGILAIYASEMREKGIAFDEVADILETCPAKMNGVFTVGDLKYLARTGRLSGTAAVIGNVLSIKPILRGNKDGFIVQYKMPRPQIRDSRTGLPGLQQHRRTGKTDHRYRPRRCLRRISVHHGRNPETGKSPRIHQHFLRLLHRQPRRPGYSCTVLYG